jgi:hypothetical protein
MEWGGVLVDRGFRSRGGMRGVLGWMGDGGGG